MKGGARGRSRKMLANKFCRCIKAVRKTVKARSAAKKESSAIAICVRSVLGTRGRTLRKFRCNKKTVLETQSPLKK